MATLHEYNITSAKALAQEEGQEPSCSDPATGSLSFSPKEIVALREVLRKSIGDRATSFNDNELVEIGASLLQATAIALKAKYAKRKQLDIKKYE